MKSIACSLTFLLTIGIIHAGSGKLSSIQWELYDCSSPLMLPEHGLEVSQLGKGKYRIDDSVSQGHFNCIYLTFQATNQLVPTSVPDPIESTFILKNQKVVWRSYKTIVDGRPVIRKEAMLPNILPHETQGGDSDYIWIRIDADSQQILDRLTPIAEGILQDAVKPSGPAKWDPAEWIF